MEKLKPLNGWTKANMIKAIQTKNKGLPAREYGGRYCVYKNINNNRCAVGCFLPDDFKNFACEGSVSKLMVDNPELSEVLPLSVFDLIGLQRLHDICPVDNDPRPRLISWIEENVA